MRHKLTLFSTLAALAFALAFVMACGDDDDDDAGGSEADTAAVEDTARQVAESGPDNIDYFIEHTTDNARSFFGYESEDDCRANAEDCVGDPIVAESVEVTEVEGDSASATVTADDGSTFILHLVREGDVWKLDELEFGPVELPEGVAEVEVTGTEYDFEFDEGDIEDGNVAFTLVNEGEEEHELVLAKIEPDFDLGTLLATEIGEDIEELPPGVEAFAAFTFAPPGSSATAVPETLPLEAGDYALLCLIPAEDGEPHAAKGMVAEFAIP
jgi:hypothetical protein